MSLPDNIIFGLRYAMLIVETERHAFDRRLKNHFFFWMENGLMDDGHMDDPVAALLMRKSDGALYRLPEDAEDPEGDFYRFAWPTTAHQKLAVLSGLTDMLSEERPIGDISF